MLLRRFFAVVFVSVCGAAWAPLHSSGPLEKLNVIVLDAAARPIVGAKLSIGAEVRRTDGGGFVNFAVAGPVFVDVTAPGYVPKRVDLPPGDHRVHLEFDRSRGAGASPPGAARLGSVRSARESNREPSRVRAVHCGNLGPLASVCAARRRRGLSPLRA